MAVADDLDRATDSKWDWVAEHTRKYLASGGTEGHESNGVYTLVLATTGRRTGEPRRTCLIYGTSGDEFVVVASKGGADEDPAWFKNLQADSSVGVQVGTRRFTARARVASPVEREPLWAPDGAHLPAVRRVRTENGPRNPDRPAHPAGLTPTPESAKSYSCGLRNSRGINGLATAAEQIRIPSHRARCRLSKDISRVYMAEKDVKGARTAIRASRSYRVAPF